MLDVQLLRKDIGPVSDRLASRNGYRLDVETFNGLEEQRKSLQSGTEYLQSQRNLLSKQIGEAKKKGDARAADELMAQVNEFAGKLQENQERLGPVLKAIDDFLLTIPNVPHSSVPVGKSSEDNVEVRRVGDPRKFGFAPRDHVDVGAGLGMLVRYLTRAQNAFGALRICAVSPALDQVLAVTRLKPILQPFTTESEAIADAHRTRRDEFSAPDILCVDQSDDVLAYVRELLRGDGYRVMTASNLPDAVILLSATRPKVVLAGTMPPAAGGTRAADEFRRLTAACTLVELPSDFAGREAADAAGHLLGAIRGIFPRRTMTPP